MVFINGFGIEIIPTEDETNLPSSAFFSLVKEYKQEGVNYAILKNGINYKIKLYNEKYVGCSVKVKIDGQCIGEWEIRAEDHIIIKCPDGSISEGGLITAIFYPRNSYSLREIIPSITVGIKNHRILTESEITLLNSTNCKMNSFADDEIDWDLVKTINLYLVKKLH